jgi:hypothetical protein
VTVSNSTLSGNTAYTSGGGIFNFDTLTVSNSTLSGNSAVGNSAVGTFSEGGGIFNFVTLTVSNSTLSGNTAYFGGGIYNDGTVPTTLTLTNVTVTANRANIGGGLFVYPNGGSLWLLHNTLIGGNFRGATGTTRDDVHGPLNAGGDYNLIGDGSGMTGLQNGAGGNLVGSASVPIDPLLGPLQDNGGPTETMALEAGSPALNAGDPGQLGVPDQRGVVHSGGVNIGAYQASASAFVLTDLPNSTTAGTPLDVTITAVDPFGQTALGYRGTATFSTSDTNPAVLLPANYPFTAGDNGRHTFPAGVTLVTAGSQTVTAADTATSAITGNATVAVNPAAADHLMFLQQPTDTAAGQTITPALTVAVVDQFGNVVTSDNSDTVTVAIGTNPSGGTLSGTLTVTVSGGIATFGDLSIDLFGDGYTLHATTTGLTDTDSAAFSITA